MSEHNGSGKAKAPSKTAARHTAKLLHDMVTLAELQAELAKIELQQRLKEAAKPGVLLIGSVCVALGCTPVLLLSLAYFLTDVVGLEHALSLLIATLVGLITAVAGALVALRGLKSSIDFSRSQDEFNRNVKWMKQVLKHKCNPAHEDCGDARTDLLHMESHLRS